MKQIYEFEYFHIEKSGFFATSRKQELIEQNDGHFWIQRVLITLEKLLSTLHQMAVDK